ncbi:MAG: hypothetical protein ACI9Y1_002580 [Lentisphaeria bacterium]|jgi:hypothetical protein
MFRTETVLPCKFHITKNWATLPRTLRLFAKAPSLIAGLVLCLSGHLQAESARLSLGMETGAVWQNYNDVQISGNTGTRFSLSDLSGNDPLPFYRIELFYDLTDKYQLRFLVAPLGYTENGVLDKNVNFDGETFGVGEPTEAKYKFNSYRATYRYLFYNGKKWRWRIGGTLKVRDAEIALQQDDVSASNSNIGVVPLLNLYGEFEIDDKWKFIVDFDGLASSKGRAIDLALKVNYLVGKNWSLGGGLRILDGGADNAKVYNFAQFNYAVASVGYRFNSNSN